MRVPRIRIQLKESEKLKTLNIKNNLISKPCCPLCEDVNKYCGRITRSFSKIIHNNFYNLIYDIIIYETYRCMPLLGDEKIHAPDWDEHIVRYKIVFIKKEASL